MSRRALRESGMIDRMSTWAVEMYKFKNNINLSEEEFNNLKNTEEIKKEAVKRLNLMDLEDRLHEMYRGLRNSNMCRKEAVYIIDNIPDELMVNLEEWLDNKPLSDIKIHGFSINDILKDFPYVNFTQALTCMIDWKAQGFLDSNFIIRYFAIR